MRAFIGALVVLGILALAAAPAHASSGTTVSGVFTFNDCWFGCTSSTVVANVTVPAAGYTVQGTITIQGSTDGGVLMLSPGTKSVQVPGSGTFQFSFTTPTAGAYRLILSSQNPNDYAQSDPYTCTYSLVPPSPIESIPVVGSFASSLASFTFTQLDWAALAILLVTAVLAIWRRSVIKQNKLFLIFFVDAGIAASAILTFSFSMVIIGALALPMVPWFVRKKHYLYAALPVVVLAGPTIVGMLGGGFAQLVLGGILQGLASFMLDIFTVVSFAYGAFELIFKVKNVPTLSAAKLSGAKSGSVAGSWEEEEKKGAEPDAEDA